MTAPPRLGGAPDEHEVPAWVTDLSPTGTATAVWLNVAGGLTYRLGDGTYLKWKPHGDSDFSSEQRRLEWASTYITAPRVVASGVHDTGPWLRMEAIPGRSAVDERWSAHPQLAAQAIGAGLRYLHDTLPVADCPFDWSVQSRVATKDISEAVAEVALGPMPKVDRLVVCHGDPCAPNTLIADDGTWCGHVDFDALGVADRWADIAVATYSLEWNYGDGFERTLLAAYGVEPDPQRTQYYRAIWDLS